MKQILSIFFFLQFITPVNSQSRFDITTDIFGTTLVCNHQTADDILDADGRGDEIFVQYFIAVADINGTIKKRMITANLDINMMMTGGNYPLNKPLFSSQPINDDEFLIFIPVVWEKDKYINTNILPAFNANMNACMDMIATQAAVEYGEVLRRFKNNENHTAPYDYPIAILRNVNNFSWNSFTGLPGFKTIIAPLTSDAGSRPVGITSEGEFTPALFMLSKYQLNDMGQSLDRNVKEVFEFNLSASYNENAIRKTSNNGDYTVLIKVIKRRTNPDQPSPINNPVPPGKTVLDPNNRPINTIQSPPVNTINQPFSINGNWKGNWIEAKNNSSVVYTVEINQDGYLKVLNQNGRPDATGTYTFANNTFNATYTLKGGTYVVTGVYDSRTKILSGTWKQTNSITFLTGNWSLTKY